jgi:hypothetical protein
MHIPPVKLALIAPERNGVPIVMEQKTSIRDVTAQQEAPRQTGTIVRYTRGYLVG